MHKRIAAAIVALLLFAICVSACAEGFSTLDSLAHEKIGVMTGSVFDELALKTWPDCTIEFLDSSSEMALSLLNGNIAATLLDLPMANEMISGVDGLHIIPERLIQYNYAAAFPKTPNGARLRDEFNAFLREARRSKLYNELYNIWLGVNRTKQMTGDLAALTAVNGTINLATDSENEPFEYVENGETTGFEIDILLRFCEKYGYGLSINDMTFSSILPGLASEKYDMAVACISITEERSESVYFSDPIYEGGVVAIVRNDNLPLAGKSASSFWEGLRVSFDKNFIRENRWLMIADGIGVTLIISVGAGVLGLALGFGLCLLRISHNRPIKCASYGAIRVIQGTPVVVLLMILYYIVFNKAGLSGIAVAIIAFGVNFGANSAEIFYSGIASVDRGQREAAAAIGLSRTKTFLKIILPQAAISFLPSLKSEFISLVKTTSVVGYVAVQDLTKVSDVIRSRTYDAFFPLIVTAAIYFVLSVMLSSLLNLIKLRIDPKRRKRVLKGVNLQQ